MGTSNNNNYYRLNNNQQKKRTSEIVHRIKLKECEKKDKSLDLARELKKL